LGGRVRLLFILSAALAGQAVHGQEQAGREVDAKVEWLDTGISLLPGDEFGVRADGSWTNAGVDSPVFGPAGLPNTFYPGTWLPSAPLGAIIARVGSEGEVVLARAEPMTLVRNRGNLQLAMNDVPGTYDDNIGSLKAVILYNVRAARMLGFVKSPFSRATQWLDRYQITPTLEYIESDAPVDSIVEQSPGAGTDLHTVDDVRFLVSKGQSTAGGRSSAAELTQVPEVTGDPRKFGVARIEAAGLTALLAGVDDSPLAAGTILRTDPDAGTSRPRRSAVRYWAASGFNTMPNVLGAPAGQAYNALEQAGFVERSTKDELSVMDSPRIILAQDPLPFNRVALTTRVQLVRSSRISAPVTAVAGLLARLLRVGGVTSQTFKQRHIAKTRERVRVTASLDPAIETTAPEETSPRGPPVGFSVKLEVGEASIEGPVPVIGSEVRHD